MQSEIDLQRKVSQEFSKNVQSATGEINQKLDTLKEQKEKGLISETEYRQKAGNWQKGKVLLNSIAAGLSAPTQSTAGIAAAAASPAVSYQIGQHFKELAKQNSDGKLTAKQETAHILAHTVLGAATAAAGGNNALAGTISAGSAEAAAPLIGNYLYGEKDGSKLTAEQKKTVSGILSLGGVTVGAVAGGSESDWVAGGQAAQTAVENNTVEELRIEAIREAELRNRDPEWDKALREAERQQLAILNEAAKLLITPYGAGSDYYEATDLSGKALAIASIIPVERATAKGYGLAKRLFEEAASLYKSNKLTLAGKKAEQAVVELQRGRIKQWNQLANKLNANSVYRFDNGFQYATDAQKRVKEVTADLKIDPWDRNTYQRRTSGGSCRKDSDCGGHLIVDVRRPRRRHQFGADGCEIEWC
ncbi:VENN motif pre-toxin domain-containing protein [Neisseria yangbaofengii]|uniref:VENN motif pre-toxin domain-containing protein n=1 Tax=Neisseria yangbaofengii TaxID=2709396 RepID=UPI003530A702